MADEGDAYDPGKKVDINTLHSMDDEDESMRRYKEALIGSASANKGPADDPRIVVIQSIIIIFEDRPDGNLEFKLSSDEEKTALKKAEIVFKEGCNFKIQVNFKVQHDLVTGLKYENAISRKGIPVAKEVEMLGSYAPKDGNHSVTFPRQGWDQAPKGTLARGSYTAKTKFIDDDKAEHMKYEYSFNIKSHW